MICIQHNWIALNSNWNSIVIESIHIKFELIWIYSKSISIELIWNWSELSWFEIDLNWIESKLIWIELIQNWSELNWFKIDLNWFEMDLNWFEIDLNWFEIDLNWFKGTWGGWGGIGVVKEGLKGGLQCGSKVRPVALFYTVKDPFGGWGVAHIGGPCLLFSWSTNLIHFQLNIYKNELFFNKYFWK